MRNYRPLLKFIPVLLTACASLTSPMATSKDGISVSLHGVNYTDRSFQYVLLDPKDPSNTGGGEHIAPFSAGGIMCCYTLPEKWTPGLQVQVQATHWLPKDANGKLPEITNVYTIEVPRYVDGKAGELWILRTKEGNIEVVSSDLQPNHPDWPGKVKGWPEPSIEYRHERWELERKLAEIDVNAYRGLIAKMKNNPQGQLLKAWEHDKKYSRNEVKDFAGPEDPNYAVYLKNRYADGLKRTEAKLKNFSKEKQ
jgi:hypothetical protein